MKGGRELLIGQLLIGQMQAGNRACQGQPTHGDPKQAPHPWHQPEQATSQSSTLRGMNS